MSMTFQSYPSRELPQQKPSRLQLLQADYQHKLLREKEEKLIKILESEEQKNTQRIRRVTSNERNDSAPIAGASSRLRAAGQRRADQQPLSAGSSHGQQQKPLFQPIIHERSGGAVAAVPPHRRGYDKSSPLAPIESHRHDSAGRPNASVLRKQNSLGKGSANPFSQDDYRAAHSDSDVPNPRIGGGAGSNLNRGTYKLSDFQKWRVEQDEEKQKTNQRVKNEGTGDAMRMHDDTIDAPVKDARRQLQASSSAGDGSSVAKTRAAAAAGRTGAIPGPPAAAPAAPAPAAGVTAASRARAPKVSQPIKRMDSYDNDNEENDDEVHSQEAERQALIEQLEAEHARKLQELEALRQRQTIKEEQKKRLTRVAKQYSTDEDAYGDNDDDDEEADDYGARGALRRQQPLPPPPPLQRAVAPQQQQQRHPGQHPARVGHPLRQPDEPPTRVAKAPQETPLGAKQKVAPVAAATTAAHRAESFAVVDETGAEISMAPCPICERSFAEDRLQKHVAVCEKTSNKQRKIFDATKQRLAGSGAEKYIGQPKRRDMNNRPKKDWRKQHEDFVNTIRYAKRVTELEKTGGDLTSLTPPPPTQHPDYVKCQYCGRSFDPDVAARHVPKCKDIKNRPAAPQRRK